MARAATPDILAQAGQGDDGGLVAAMGPQVVRLDIAVIRLDGGTQPRAGIDQAVVVDYAYDMTNGAQFPPVQVVHDGASYWVWDGFHRVHARRMAGHHTVPAIVRQGTRRDAVLLSVGANATHGFRRTSEDKRRAVETLLRDEEWVMWSDREIARRCAVDGKTVAARRAALSAEIPQIGEERRAVRNGTSYTVSVPKRQPAPAVASQEADYAQESVRQVTRDERMAAALEYDRQRKEMARCAVDTFVAYAEDHGYTGILRWIAYRIHETAQWDDLAHQTRRELWRMIGDALVKQVIDRQDRNTSLERIREVVDERFSDAGLNGVLWPEEVRA